MLMKPSHHSLLQTGGRQPLEGFVIYSPVEHWWGRLFGQFAHCALMIRKGDMWVYFEPSLGFNEVAVFPVGTRWAEQFPDAVIQRFRVWRTVRRYRCPHLLQPFTCVEQVKAFLGLRSPWLITPRQLYRRLHGRNL